jgi:hypothetical protein
MLSPRRGRWRCHPDSATLTWPSVFFRGGSAFHVRLPPHCSLPGDTVAEELTCWNDLFSLSSRGGSGVLACNVRGSPSSPEPSAPIRGYFNGEELLACEEAAVMATLPKPMTSGARSEGYFGEQDSSILRR